MMARFVLVLIGLALLSGCGGGTSLPMCEDQAQPADVDQGYRLASGDQVRVTVFRHPDLSGEFSVDGQGTLALPLIGDISANGMTTGQLKQAVENRFRQEGYLVEPRVSIDVLTYRPFYILGEVSSPGEYEYKSGMTVANAVALAGGFSYRAAEGAITLRRGNCAAPGPAHALVLPGDIVDVPERFF